MKTLLAMTLVAACTVLFPTARAQANLDWSISFPNDVPTAEATAIPFISPPITLSREQVVRIRVTNLAGEPEAATLQVRSLLWPGFSSAQVAASVQSGCSGTVSTVPNVPPDRDLQFDWLVGPLNANDSRSCDLRLQAVPTAVDQGLVLNLQLLRGGQQISSRLLSFTVSPNPTTLADLGVRIHPMPVIAPGGTTQTFDVEMFNRGPGVYIRSTTVIRSTRYRHAFQFGAPTPDPFWLLGTGDPRCQVFVEELGSGQVNSRWFDLVFPTLAPGESRRCTLAVRSFPDAVGRDSVGFTVGNYGVGHFDPDVSNNVGYLELVFGAEPVPLGDGRAWLLLSGLLVLFGAAYLRRSRAEV